MDRGARGQPERRRPFAVAVAADPRPRGERGQGRGRRHADRLRAVCRQAPAEGPQARPRPVGGQPRHQHRRRRDLFRHHRGRHGRLPAGHPVDRLQPGLYARPSGEVGDRDGPRCRRGAPGAGARLAAQRAGQHQLPRRRGGRGPGRAGHPYRHARLRRSYRRAQGSARRHLLLDRLRPAGERDRRGERHRRRPLGPHLGDPAAPRPDPPRACAARLVADFEAQPIDLD